MLIKWVLGLKKIDRNGNHMIPFNWQPSRRAVLTGALGSAALLAGGRWPALAADGP